jgi:hypothetical protein
MSNPDEQENVGETVRDIYMGIPIEMWDLYSSFIGGVGTTEKRTPIMLKWLRKIIKRFNEANLEMPLT